MTEYALPDNAVDYTEAARWETNIYIAPQDLWLVGGAYTLPSNLHESGSPVGGYNLPLQQLANRTAYLKQQVEEAFALRMGKTNQQAVTAGNGSLHVSFDHEFYGGSKWNGTSNLCVIEKDGIHDIKANVIWLGMEDGVPCWLELIVNGQAVARGSEIPGSNVNISTPLVTDYWLAEGDEVYITANWYGETDGGFIGITSQPNPEIYSYLSIRHTGITVLPE